MLNTMGIIFAGNEELRMGELTRARSLAAMPVAGRYRLIDFILSSMVNSGITNIGLTTKFNFQSLLDHLGGGTEWDLSRKKYGLFILPPFYKSENRITESGESKIQSLYNVLHYIRRGKQDYCMLAEGNAVINTTFDEMLDFHRENHSDITVMYSKNADATASQDGCFDVAADNRIKDISPNNTQNAAKSVGFCIIDTDLLITLVESCYARGEYDFSKDIIGKNLTKLRIFGYEFNGYYRHIYDIQSYYRFSMELLNRDVRDTLFENEKKIYTKIKDMVPARYQSNAKVSNSFIADGCIIDGEVNNSVLFRAVEVRKGSKINNCIIMQNGKVLENSVLNAVIMDKNVVIGSGKTLVSEPTFPIVIGKNRVI
ncbi:MAG: glucose-1-phosphate adenylyltransferase subunit GlgD [Clostridia bacterium]|nr:glucose-1-phosphate adenylyltransferase subunit GlgD [Clostridia bacterium]